MVKFRVNLDTTTGLPVLELQYNTPSTELIDNSFKVFEGLATEKVEILNELNEPIEVNTHRLELTSVANENGTTQVTIKLIANDIP